MPDLATVQYTHRIITEQAKSIGANYLRYYSTEQISNTDQPLIVDRSLIPLPENWTKALGPTGSALATNILALPPVVRSVKISTDELSVEFNPAVIIEEFKEPINQIFRKITGLTPDFDKMLDELANQVLERLATYIAPTNEHERERFVAKCRLKAVELSSNRFSAGEIDQIAEKAADIAYYSGNHRR